MRGVDSELECLCPPISLYQHPGGEEVLMEQAGMACGVHCLLDDMFHGSSLYGGM